MENAIRERYSEAILAEACRRYDIRPVDIILLDGFESFMFEYNRKGAAYILRLSHSIRRSAAMIQGEVDWINYLADGGVGVARAVPSQGDHFVESIDDGQGGYFLATAFERAQGGPAWQNNQWNENLFVRYGRTIGRMHALSREYEPPDPSWRRPEWDDPINADELDWLPDEQWLVRKKGKAVINYLQSLPKDNDSYGLIHFDAHAGNFFADDQGKITLFDFDDCAYSWYVNDLAMVVFYAVTNHADPEQVARDFWPTFWRGYCEENELDTKWLVEMPVFFKLREIVLYAIIHRSFDIENLGDGWVAAFMKDRRRRIEEDIPYLDYDFVT